MKCHARGAIALCALLATVAATPSDVAAQDAHEATVGPDRCLPRIAIRAGRPHARFVVKKTGEPFFVKGFNYVRLRHSHATFEAATRTTPAHYDAQAAAAMLETLRRCGYNTVRVFICGRHPKDPGIAGNFDTTRGLYRPYLDNFADFLDRARRHGVYVLPTFGDGELPRNAYYHEKLAGLPRSKNAVYFTREGIEAKKEYVTEFLRFIAERDPGLLTALLGVQCQNELYVRGDQWPFDRREGTFTGVDGTTYDLSDASQRQALADDGLRLYHAALARAIKAIDPELLVTEGLFALRAVGQSLATHQGIWPGSSRDPRFPPTLLSLGRGELDFLDVHFYRTRPQETVAEAFEKDMESSLLDAPEMSPVRREKPIIVGEFGAFRHVEGDFAHARENLLAIRDVILQRRFNGMLYWTYDTHEQQALYPATEGGEPFLRELADLGE
jgi:hypothetical protein